MRKVNALWYVKRYHWVSILLLPFSWLFALLVLIRRTCYQKNIFRVHRFKTPIIVVGNITVGGTGKTPLVAWLANQLSVRGYRPGIISRGYGSKPHSKPFSVTSTTPVEEAGDEALMLARQTHCPVMIGKDRVLDVIELIARTDCNVIIADDGLQHYRLGRAVEIAVVDAARGLGNGLMLPAGPLREPVSRLQSVDFTVENGKTTASPSLGMQLLPKEFISLVDNKSRPLSGFPTKKAHAVAGIGNPDRFFAMLTGLGFDIIPHAFPDHHDFQAEDLQFNDHYPVMMTEKDAVKCALFADKRCWYLAVDVKVDDALLVELQRKLNELEVCNEPKAMLS